LVARSAAVSAAVATTCCAFIACATAGSLLVANLMGLWLGEWREAPPAARRWLWAGLATLVAAVVLLAARAG